MALKSPISSITSPPDSCTLEHAVAEIERELAVRARIYDRWIAEGKLAYVDAADRFARMLKALIALQKLVDLEASTTDWLPEQADTDPHPSLPAQFA